MFGQQPGGAFQYGMQQQPVFKQISVGQGIDMKEFQSITQCCIQAYQLKQNPISTVSANLIKQQLKGEWFVYVCELGKKDYDFALTTLKGGDFMSFSIDNKLFQVCRLK